MCVFNNIYAIAGFDTRSIFYKFNRFLFRMFILVYQLQ